MSGGYCPCACRDCFEIAITSEDGKRELCWECREAGCEPWPGDEAPKARGTNYECQRPEAYGCGEDEPWPEVWPPEPLGL